MGGVFDGFPDLVTASLKQLVTDLKPLAPEPMALVAYGSVVRGGYRARRSDVNVLLVMGKPGAEPLAAMRDPLRRAFRAVRVAPFIVSKSELPRLADVFPVKIADIQRHHRLLSGEDPLVDVHVKPADLRLRVEQELRNHQLRLRRSYVFTGDEPADLRRTLVSGVTSLSVVLEAMMMLTAHGTDGDSVPDIFRSAAKAYDLDAKALARLAAVRDGADDDNVTELYVALMSCVGRAVEVADTLEVGG